MGMHMFVGGIMSFLVRMALLPCPTKQAADFVRCQIRNNLHPFLEFVGDAFDVVRLHDAEHYFLVYRKRYVDFRAFHHCRPVLVADGMTEFDGDANDVVRVFAAQCFHVYDQYGT